MLQTKHAYQYFKLMQIQLHFRNRSLDCKYFLCSFRKAVKLERQISIYSGSQLAVKCFKSYSFCPYIAILKRNNKTLSLTCFSNSHPTSNQLPSFNASISPMFLQTVHFSLLPKPAHHSSHQPLLPEFCHFSVSWLPLGSPYCQSSFQNTNQIMPFLCFNLQWFPTSLLQDCLLHPFDLTPLYHSQPHLLNLIIVFGSTESSLLHTAFL